jgi:hypothetical protein
MSGVQIEGKSRNAIPQLRFPRWLLGGYRGPQRLNFRAGFTNDTDKKLNSDEDSIER